MSKSSKRPQQAQLVPSNPVEALYLNQSKIYNQSENIFLEEVQMNSAFNDMNFLNNRELQWPTKEVRQSREVTFSIPGEQDMRTESTELIRRVPMTEEEAAAHYLQLSKDLIARSRPNKKVTKKNH